jgi:hypothetical protein
MIKKQIKKISKGKPKIKATELYKLLFDDFIDYGFVVIKKSKGETKRINPKQYLDRNPELKLKKL